MKKIKVLIVDDSAFMRKLIKEFLSEESRIEVVGTARNGQEAIEKIQQIKPDVVTLDIEMPVMNGLDALKAIMEKCSTAVIMLSSTTEKSAESTVAAMELGAVDFIAKPSGAISLDLHKIKNELLEKILIAGNVNLLNLQKSFEKSKKNLIPSYNYSKIEPYYLESNVGDVSKKSLFGKKIILIGTSTGGPRALQTVLTALPHDIDAPIMIVQHMPPGFTKSLANRLNSLSKIRVKEAEDGEIFKKGTAYIAPGGYHLKLKKVGMSLAASLEMDELRNGHRPSVDVLFESASKITDYKKIAIVMTGMGSDGRRGLIALKKTGTVYAIAESKETAIVFGMPKAAIATHLIDKVENVERIAHAIVDYW